MSKVHIHLRPLLKLAVSKVNFVNPTLLPPYARHDLTETRRPPKGARTRISKAEIRPSRE